MEPSGVGAPANVEFIPCSRRTALSHPGSINCLGKRLRRDASLGPKGLPPVSVSVNVSRADIYNADLPGILTETVERYGQPPSRLHLEITESAYTENPDQIIETVGRLRKLDLSLRWTTSAEATPRSTCSIRCPWMS